MWSHLALSRRSSLAAFSRPTAGRPFCDACAPTTASAAISVRIRGGVGCDRLGHSCGRAIRTHMDFRTWGKVFPLCLPPLPPPDRSSADSPGSSECGQALALVAVAQIVFIRQLLLDRAAILSKGIGGRGTLGQPPIFRQVHSGKKAHSNRLPNLFSVWPKPALQAARRKQMSRAVVFLALVA